MLVFGFFACCFLLVCLEAAVYGKVMDESENKERKENLCDKVDNELFNAPFVLKNRLKDAIVYMNIFKSFRERKATEETDLIGLSTHGTMDRLDYIQQQINVWKGPTSIAIYFNCVHDGEASFNQLLSYAKANAQNGNVTVTLVLFNSPSAKVYPINAMRNIAISAFNEMNRNAFLFPVDADVLPNKEMTSVVNEIKAMERKKKPNELLKSLYVLPTFEFVNADLETFDVASKTALSAAYLSRKIQPMHFPKLSYSFPDLLDWLQDGEEEGDVRAMPYSILNEHYVIGKSHVFTKLHLFDENFVGRGLNKQALHFELWANDFEFFIMRSSFLMNRKNPMEEQANHRAFAKNVDYWKSFRKRVENEYRLHCKEMLWKICDERAQMCDRVCGRGVERAKPVNLDDVLINAYLNRRKSEIVTEESFATDRKSCLSKLDVVYTWVNYTKREIEGFEVLYGNGRSEYIEDAFRLMRFRDFGPHVSTLRFSIASVRKHLKNLNKIFVVVSDMQRKSLPDFLVNDETVEIVYHSQIFENQNCLPTFHSCAIETQIDNIPRLSECYLYLNDDILLVNPLDLNQYWPHDSRFPSPVFIKELLPHSMAPNDRWKTKLRNLSVLLQKELDVRWNELFSSGHVGHLFVKSFVKKTKKRFEKYFKTTQCERFRTLHSVWLPVIYNNYLAHEYRFTPPAFDHSFSYFAVTNSLKKMKAFSSKENLDKIKRTKRWVCFNDLIEEEEVDVEVLRELKEAMEYLVGIVRS